MQMARRSSSRGELDLDSFLRSHGADSSDVEDDDRETDVNGFRQRTVDEILDGSDSSSSSGGGAPRRITAAALPSAEGATARSRDPSGEGEEERTRRTASNAPLGELGAVSTVTDSGKLSTSSLSSRGTRRAVSLSAYRSLPPLFGGLWTNPKPGAALAVAAAASRSIPMPYAAAIKSRRASVGLPEKIYQFLDLSDDSSFEESGILDVTQEGDSSSVNSLGGEASEEAHPGENTFHSSPPSPSSSSSSVSPDPNEREISAADDNAVPHDFWTEKEDNVAEENIEAAPDSTELGSQASAYVIETEIIGEEGLNSPLSHAAVEEHQLGEEFQFHDRSPDKSDAVSQDASVSGSTEEIKIQFHERKNSAEKASKWELNEKAARKAEKKLRSTMKPLEWAEELEKRQASSGLHWEEGAVAQPMRLKGIRREPPAVGYLQTNSENAVTRSVSSQTFVRDHGSPTVLAVHLNSIAVGTSKGLVLMIPSKYSSQLEDNMDAKTSVLGSTGDKPHVPVTSMCFNPQGDLLLVGYADGHLTVWDVQKASYLKIISGEHSAPVVHVLFLGQDLQVTRQFKVVTGDSKGLVLLHIFSGVRLLNFFSVKTQCLLDGRKTETTLSASPLHINEAYFGSSSTQGSGGAPSNSLGSMVGGVVGGEVGRKLFSEGMLAEEGVVIFATHQNALVVRLSPNLEVYEKLSRPDGTREGSLPYTAWKSSPYSPDMPSGHPDRVSWLSIAWDRKVEIFMLIKSKLTKHCSWNIDSEVVGVQWLDDEMLVIVTLRGYLGLYRKDGEELHRTSFVLDAPGSDDVITYHTYFTNSFGNPEKAYHNSVAVRGATVYILSRTQLIVSRLLPWRERIWTLQRAGDWMGALDLAMRLYDGQAHGVIDLPKSVDAIREVMLPFLLEMIFSYVDEVFSYISVTSGFHIVTANQEEDPNLRNTSSTEEAEEQFSCVAGVAVEFCVHIRRLDILFDDIFSRFVSVQHGGTFLEILEPYILKDMLGCLPPEIMQALVEHYSSRGWLQRVEQCVLHMDISSLDFNQVTRLCREHGLYSALVYLFNRGLDDYRTPLEDLLVVIQNDQRTDAALQYKMLVYLKYCFLGLAFPPGHGTLPPNRLPSVRKELLEFLLEDSAALSSKVVQNFKASYGACPNLCYLLWLDAESSLQVLKSAFTEAPVNSKNSMEQYSEVNVEHKVDASKDSEDLKFFLQNIVNLLILILNVESKETRSFQVDENGIIERWPLKRDISQIIDFIASFTASQQVTVSGGVLTYILEYLTSAELSPTSEMEKKVLSLLKVAHKMDWDSSTVLDQCQKAQFFQACGLIHTMRGNYLSALGSYMKDLNESFIAFVFIYDTMSKLTNSELSTFRFGVKARIPELVKLSREDTFLLVLDLFGKEGMQILSELQGYPESLFLFLKTIIDVHLHGALNFPVLRDSQSSEVSLRMKERSRDLGKYYDRVSDFSSLLRKNPFSVDDKMAERYIELMCQYEPKSVLHFLETFDNYRLEHCLRLCQEYGVNDAAAFLLERVGDVGGALEFLMSGLDEKIEILINAVEAVCAGNSGSLHNADLLNTCLNMDEVSSLRDILNMGIGLCQRNTLRLDLRESELLWFRLLDLYCEPLRALYDYRESSLADQASDYPRSRRRSSFKHKFLIPVRGVSILRVIFSHFVKELVEKMAGNVPLLSVMSKILADNGAQEFGDFKLALLELLGTYGFERRILGTAKLLIEDDTFYTLDLLRKRASHAYAPQSLVCCLCGYSLAKVSSSSSIRVFSCGHATHVHCEPQENGSGVRDSPHGCPICMPKRKPVLPRDKSVILENTLISYPRAPAAKGASGIYHLHEPEALEKPHGAPLSRFEILSGLKESQRLIQAEPIPPLRLAPPSIYHEKVQKGHDSRDSLRNKEMSKSSQPRNARSKGFSKRFPLKSTIFGKEKIVNR